MISNSVKNITENIPKNINNKKLSNPSQSSSNIQNGIKVSHSFHHRRFINKIKNKSKKIIQIRRNSDIELKKLEIYLSENEDLNNYENCENAKNLIYSLYQLNGAIPRKDFNKDDPDNNILLVVKKIFKIFEKYNFFFFFFSLYNIKNEIIMKIIPYMRYKSYKKNDFIVKEGEESKSFYFLLKGKISFSRKISDGSEVTYFYKENEGYHFGQWEIINNRNNKYSIKCLENTYLIYISKDIFKRYIQDNYIKVENDIKNFLMSNLRQYVLMPPAKLERFIESDVKTLSFRKNDIIFKQGEETKFLYLIYKGEVNIIKDVDKCDDSLLISPKNNLSVETLQNKAKKINYKKIIKKKLIKDDDSKNNMKLELSLNKNKYNIMTTLTKGSFIGLEIVTGIYNFKYTYLCKSEFTSLLEINIENFDEHLKELMVNLMPYFLGLDNKISQQIDKITYLNYNLRPKSIQKNKSRNIEYKYNTFIDSIKIEEDEKSFVKQINKIDKKFDTNEAGFIKLNEYNKNLQAQRNLLIDKLRENYFKSKSLDLFLGNFRKDKIKNLKFKKVNMLYKNKRKNNSFLIERKKHIFNDNKIFDKFRAKSTKNYEHNNAKKIFNLYDKEQMKDMKKMINIEKNNKKNYLSFVRLQRNKNRINDIKQGLSLDCKKLVKKVYIKKNIQLDNHEIKIRNFIFQKNKENKIETSKDNKIVKVDKYTSFYDDDRISKTIDDKIKNKKIIIRNICDKKEKRLKFYNTGIFDMPLATQLSLISKSKN